MGKESQRSFNKSIGTMPKIVAVVPTWNGERTISNCLQSLNNQTVAVSTIIVIDNNSTDATRHVVKTSFPKVTLITLPENLGVVGGRNAGIASAGDKYDYILFFDHDMEAGRDMVKSLLDTAITLKADIVTPKIVYKSDPTVIWSAGTDVNLITGQVLFRNGLDSYQFNCDQAVQIAPAAMLVSRQVISEVKKFDPIFVSSWEDADFCFRAKKMGFTIYYSAKATALHDLSRNPVEEVYRLFDRYAFYIGQNRILFMRRFGKNFFLFLAVFLPLFLLYYLFLAFRYQRIGKYLNLLRGTLSGILLATSPTFPK